MNQPHNRVACSARWFLTGMHSLLVTVAACGPTRQPETVIVVVLDSVTSEALSDDHPDGGISSSRTPHLARFAEASSVFADHISASTGTNAAMATLVSGLPPWEHGVGSLRRRGRGRLSASFTTHAERFAEAGYDTLAAVALPQLRANLSGLLQGFDTVLEPDLDLHAGWTSDELWSRIANPLYRLLQGGGDLFAVLYLADQREPLRAESRPSADMLIRRLGPFRGQDARIDGALTLAATDPLAALAELDACLGRGRGSAAHGALQAARSDAALAGMDLCLGRLLYLLEDTGRARTATIQVLGGAPAASARDSEARFPGERTVTPCLLRVAGERIGRRMDGAIQSTAIWTQVLESYGLSEDAIGDPAGVRPVVCVNADRSSGAVYDGDLRLELDVGGSTRLFRRSDGARVERDALHEQGARIERLKGVLADRLAHGIWRIEGDPAGSDELRIGWSFAGGVVHATQVGSQPVVRAAQARASGATKLTGAPMEMTLFGSALDLPLRLRLGGPAFADFEPARYFLGESSFEQLPVLWLPCAAQRDRAEPAEVAPDEELAASLDLEHQGRGWWQLSVDAPDGQRVRALMALYPPGELDDPLKVDLAGCDGSLEPVPGRRDACWVSGAAPFRMRVRKDPGSELALHVEVDGLPLEPRMLRVGGRPYALDDEVELYLPDWMPGLTEALDGAPQLATESTGPGPGRVRIMRGRGRQIERTAFDGSQLEFVRRLGPNE
ncbi:MAG: hypothetical protein ACI8Y8_004362 [Planctomycetota bacterium]